MDDKHSIIPRSMSSGKTTLTFRIMPDVKLQLAERALELGLSPSQYVEALVVKGHFEQQQQAKRSPATDTLQLPKDTAAHYHYFLGKLKNKFPSHRDTDIVIACLAHAFENAGALWQRSLNTFLNRITTDFYQTKIEKDDN